MEILYEVVVVEAQNQVLVDPLHETEPIVSLAKLYRTHGVLAFDVQVDTHHALVQVGGLERASHPHGKILHQPANEECLHFPITVGLAHHDGVGLLPPNISEQLGGKRIDRFHLLPHHSHRVHRVSLLRGLT